MPGLKELKEKRDAIVSAWGMLNAAFQREVDLFMRMAIAYGSRHQGSLSFMRIGGCESHSLKNLISSVLRNFDEQLPAEIREDLRSWERVLDGEAEGYANMTDTPSDRELQEWLLTNCDPEQAMECLRLQGHRDYALILAGYRAGWAHANSHEE